MAKEFEIFYPNVYDEHDKKIIDDSLDMAFGRKAGGPVGMAGMPPMGGNKPVDKDEMVAYAKQWLPYNPMFFDEKYAQDTRWGGLIAAPTFKEVGGMGIMFMGDLGIEYRGMSEGELIPGNGMDHEIFYYKPIRPGDTFKTEAGEKEFRDITPEVGSTVRCLWSKGESFLYNQEGDLVAKQVSRSGSNWKRYKDPADREPGKLPRKNMAQYRTCHKYTGEDYDKIRQLWKNELVRGKDTLYWEDVAVGDEPTPTCDGPITAIDMIRLHGDAITKAGSMRDRIAEDRVRGLECDDYGLYYLDWAQHYCDRNIPGARPVYYNTTARNFIVRMVTNWCGDDGFVSKIAWRLCYETARQGNVFPESWDRPSYLFKVPYLKAAGKYMNTHGIVGDTAISKGYVVDKYIQDGKHYVELVCWVEDLDGNIMQEGAATVMLPSRNK